MRRCSAAGTAASPAIWSLNSATDEALEPRHRNALPDEHLIWMSISSAISSGQRGRARRDGARTSAKADELVRRHAEVEM